MSIQQLISWTVPTLAPTDTVRRALEILDENKLAGVPVVTEDDYTAYVTEDTLLEVPDDSLTLDAANQLQFKPAIAATAHPYDAFSMMHEAALPLLPVIDQEHKYVGCLSRKDLIDYFATQSGIGNPGGVLVVEVAPRNYSMYDIARICENEDVAILGMQLRTNEQAMIEVTLKLNRTVLDAVAASFVRHNYHVVEVYGRESDKEDIMGNYNLLMNYINM
jgi:CBS domain-containing protein